VISSDEIVGVASKAKGGQIHSPPTGLSRRLRIREQPGYLLIVSIFDYKLFDFSFLEIIFRMILN
jgi:hypothetical protein